MTWNERRISRQLKLRDLHVLMTVARCGSMGKAANQLSVSQPAISKAIADMEAALGVRLLDRNPRGVVPTIYARALLDRGLVAFHSAAETEVIAVSGDPKEKAESEVNEENWRFPVGYDLRPDQMRQLGLYISEPRSPQETDRPFAEPGLFIINPQGKIQVVDISNAPFARPELGGVLKGLKFIQEKQYPIRGTLA